MRELYLHNTYTGKKEKFVPITPGKIGMYVCGVTVYDRCHLGHARAVVVFDVIYRFLSACGYDVVFVRNFTDVDDKIINRANERGVLWNELAEFFIKKFKEDFDCLNILTPSFEPKATENINEIITAVGELVDKGFAYEKNGDVFFRVRKFGDYGKLSKRSVDDLISGARVEVNEVKDDPLDFALWKKSKDGEPYWESPWGKGRPGWHIECSVMSRKYLGAHFDIHGGGHDLIFPHHENEIAQSEALSGFKFANYWVHNGFVTINKEKMSKSTGNFFALEDIYKHCEPRFLRFFLVSRHYRVPLDYSLESLDESKMAWGRIENTVGVADHILSKSTIKTDGLDEVCINKFYDVMSDDFNTSEAIAVLFDLVNDINQSIASNKIDINLALKNNTIKEISSVLGLELKPSGLCFVSVEESSIEPDIDTYQRLLSKPELDDNEARGVIKLRLGFRANKNFDQADSIRKALSERKYILRDTKEGTIFFKI